jgi:hypothetical protein
MPSRTLQVRKWCLKDVEVLMKICIIGLSTS